MNRKWIAIAALALVAVALFGALVWANLYAARSLPGGNSFLVPWMGARNFLTEQVNPYTLDAANDVQKLIYDRSAREGEYPYRLDYPFYILIFFFPFGFIDDFTLARAAWMAASEIALLTVAFLGIQLTKWKPSRINFALFLVFTLLGFYSLYPLLEGSVAIFFALFFVGALLALRSGMDGLAGILFALTTYKWEIGGLFLLFVLVWLVSHRRWRAPTVFLMTLTALVTVTLILRSDWMLPFARSVVANLRAEHGLTPGLIFQMWQPEYGSQLGLALRWILIIVLFLEWRAARGQEFQRFLWVACLTLAATPLLGIRTDVSAYTVLLLPLALVLAVAQKRWKQGRWGVGFILLALLGLWALFLRVPNADEILFLTLPLFLVISLYWIRWWAIRPPRIWVDEIAQIKKR